MVLQEDEEGERDLVDGDGVRGINPNWPPTISLCCVAWVLGLGVAVWGWQCATFCVAAWVRVGACVACAA